MIISFDVDGVLINSPYVDRHNPEKFKKWVENIKDYPIRFPEAAVDIERWQRSGHRVVAVSARHPSLQNVTVESLRPLHLNSILCSGDLKEEVLLWMSPVVHFDDHPKFGKGQGRVLVWSPSWGPNTERAVGTWDEIRDVTDRYLIGEEK